METLFWLEPGMSLLQIILGLSAFALMVSAIGHYVASDDKDFGSYKQAHMAKISKQHLKLMALLCAIVVVLSPFANIWQTYKNVLIYRGVNSVLVDKTVDTAEKALDVLNVKLDEMIKNQTPEKESDGLTEDQRIEKEALTRAIRDRICNARRSF